MGLRQLQQRAERIHPIALIGFFAMLALFEGPALIMCVLVLLTTALSGRFRGYRPGLIELGLAVWALAGLPGLLAAEGKLSSGDTTRPLFALAFWVGCLGLRGVHRETLKRISFVFLLGIVINGAFGLLQLWLGELPLDAYLLTNPKSAQIYVPDRVYHERAASGLFYNRLKLAHVGIIGIFWIGLLLGRSKRSIKALLVLGGGLLLAAVVYTYARMALVALCVAPLALGLLLASVRVIALVGLGSSGLVGLFLASGYGQRRLETLFSDFEIRRAMWGAAVSVFKAYPLLGVGHGVYRSVSVNHMPAGMTGVLLTSPHNIWLQTLAETGVVGFLGWSLALSVGFWKGVQAVRVQTGGHGSADRDGMVLDRLALMVMIALVLIGLMHFTFHHVPVALAFWTALGVAARPKTA